MFPMSRIWRIWRISSRTEKGYKSMVISLPDQPSCVLFRYFSSVCCMMSNLSESDMDLMNRVDSVCLILTDCSFYNANGHKLVLGFPVIWPLPPGATLNWGWWFTKQNFIQHRVWYVGLWSCGGLADLSEWWPWWVCCIWCCLNSCLEHQCGEMSTEFISQKKYF